MPNPIVISKPMQMFVANVYRMNSLCNLQNLNAMLIGSSITQAVKNVQQTYSVNETLIPKTSSPQCIIDANPITKGDRRTMRTHLLSQPLESILSVD